MWPAILTVMLMTIFGFSVTHLIRKRKKAQITGIKSLVISICFFLIGAVNLLAYWFDFIGIINWTLTVLLLIMGAYFSKYLPVYETERV